MGSSGNAEYMGCPPHSRDRPGQKHPGHDQKSPMVVTVPDRATRTDRSTEGPEVHPVATRKLMPVLVVPTSSLEEVPQEPQPGEGSVVGVVDSAPRLVPRP